MVALQLFDGRPDAVRGARGYARDALSHAPVAGHLDDILLLVSELATNAIVHSPAEQFMLKLWADSGRVRVECHDRGSDRPCLRRPRFDETSGRGLQLVRALSSRWGVTWSPLGRSKFVWFEIDMKCDQEGRQAC
jgi:anti-sigma regulatory factor (Ser/Thr protein kinase)